MNPETKASQTKSMILKTTILTLGIFLFVVHASAQLTGEWQDDNGSCYRIRQVGTNLYWWMDGRPRVMNVFSGTIAGNTIAGDWADIPGGSLQGNGTVSLRIESNDRMVKIDQTGNYGGNIWTRGCGSCKDDLLGTWYDSGNRERPSYITEQGDDLIFTNYFNLVSKGTCVSFNQVKATDWEGGLLGGISDDRKRIDWKNGTFWTR